MTLDIKKYILLFFLLFILGRRLIERITTNQIIMTQIYKESLSSINRLELAMFLPVDIIIKCARR